MSKNYDYEATLKAAKKDGAGVCDDAGAMALFCESGLQLAVGAVSPKLVWIGARKSGWSFEELARRCVQDRRSVESVQWLP
ncbi:hypothetical protein OG216_46890 (plasmid) [Streptomycetaceae bacterium NBC_01309]